MEVSDLRNFQNKRFIGKINKLIDLLEQVAVVNWKIKSASCRTELNGVVIMIYSSGALQVGPHELFGYHSDRLKDLFMRVGRFAIEHDLNKIIGTAAINVAQSDTDD